MRYSQHPNNFNISTCFDADFGCNTALAPILAEEARPDLPNPGSPREREPPGVLTMQMDLGDCDGQMMSWVARVKAAGG